VYWPPQARIFSDLIVHVMKKRQLSEKGLFKWQKNGENGETLENRLAGTNSLVETREMDSASDYLQYLLNFFSSAISLRKALGIVVLIICLILLRWIWRQSVKEFKNGMLSHDEPQPMSGPSHSQKQTAVKRNWETQFVRFCRASGLAIRRTAKELKAGKGPTEHSNRQICPKCGRTYQDATTRFCPADGTKLVNPDA
jgi:hypothetical protein